MPVICRKNFSITVVGGCLTCETKGIVHVSSANQDYPWMAYDPATDYCLVALQDIPTGIRFYRYDCVLNVLTLKHTLATASWTSSLVLAGNKFWFMTADGNFYWYNPVTETIADSFASGVGGTRLIWVAEKSKGYFLATGNHIYEVDFTAKTATDLGAAASAYQLIYSPVDDSIYGPSGGLWRFDLATSTYYNLGNVFVPCCPGALTICGVWDSDASVIRFFSDIGDMAEYNTGTHTVASTVSGLTTWPYAQDTVIYDPSTKFVVAVDGDGYLCYFDANDDTGHLIMSDTDQYNTVAMISSRNLLAGIMNDGAGTNAGVHKVCIP